MGLDDGWAGWHGPCEPHYRQDQQQPHPYVGHAQSVRWGNPSHDHARQIDNKAGSQCDGKEPFSAQVIVLS
jgi:hypothetical protein